MAKRSIQSTSLWNEPQKMAAMATNVVNKAADNVRKHVTNQLKKISLSPSRSAPSNPTQLDSSQLQGKIYL